MIYLCNFTILDFCKVYFFFVVIILLIIKIFNVHSIFLSVIYLMSLLQIHHLLQSFKTK